MFEPTNNNMGFAQRLSMELARDKKKTVILATLVLVGAFVGIRVVTKGSGPAQAAAVTMEVDGSVVLPEMAMAAPLAFLVESDPLDEEYLKQIDRDITRDLFAFDRSHYTPLAPEVLEVAVGDGDAEGVELPAEIDWQSIVTEQSQSLMLQSTIDSEIPIAVVNGRVLGNGDQIHGFTVVKINSTTCMIEKQGIQITLEMAD